MKEQANRYALFFSLSILTDMRQFHELVSRTGAPPLHDFKKTDWSALAARIRNTLVEDYPEIIERVTVKLFDDSMESATKGTLTESQAFEYLKTLVQRAQAGNFRAHDLRKNHWLTSYSRSAPPQDFNGVIEIEDDGSSDILESATNAILKHFYTGGEHRYGGLGSLPLIFSGKLHNDSHLSPAMLAVFSSTFNHPFENDVRLIVLNEAQQRNISAANSIRDVEKISDQESSSLMTAGEPKPDQTLTFEQFQALRQRVEVDDGSELAKILGRDDEDHAGVCFAYQTSPEDVFFIEILQQGGEDSGTYGLIDDCGYYITSTDLADLERRAFDTVCQARGEEPRSETDQ